MLYQSSFVLRLLIVFFIITFTIGCNQKSESLKLFIFNYGNEKIIKCGAGVNEAKVIIGIPNRLIQQLDTSINMDNWPYDERHCRPIGSINCQNGKFYYLFYSNRINHREIFDHKDYTLFVLENPIDTQTSLKIIEHALSEVFNQPYYIKLKRKGQGFFQINGPAVLQKKYFYEDKEVDSTSSEFNYKFNIKLESFLDLKNANCFSD